MFRGFLIITFFIIFQILPLFTNDKVFCITTEEFPPFIGNDLKGKGWTMEIARAILEPQGYQVTLELLVWARALQASKYGKYDGLYLAYYTKERTKWFVYSKPVGEVRTGFFKLKSSDISFTKLQDLRAYRIGLTRGVAISPEFDEADYLLKEEVSFDSQNIQKLLLGRIDLVATPELVFKELLKKTLTPAEYAKFEFIEPHLTVQKLYMAISRKTSNYKQKLVDFNKGLEQIKSDGTYNRILREYGFE